VVNIAEKVPTPKFSKLVFGSVYVSGSQTAESILDRAAKAMETEDIQARLTAVE
jgi:hypothetical protein